MRLALYVPKRFRSILGLLPARTWRNWNVLFTVLQGSAILAALWWTPYERLPAPGRAVACIALAAAAMSVHRGMGDSQKVVWLLLMAAFLAIEWRSISKDRWDNEQAQAAGRSEERSQFNKLITEERTNYSALLGVEKRNVESILEQEQRQFSRTLTRFGDVLDTTAKVGTTSQKSLEAVTETGSIPCVEPVRKPSADARLAVFSIGSTPLTGVVVEVREFRGRDFVSLFTEVIPTLTADFPYELTNKFRPNIGKGGDAMYMILIRTKNGFYDETLTLWPGPSGWSLGNSVYFITKVGYKDEAVEHLSECKRISPPR